MDKPDALKRIRELAHKFVDDRDWHQYQSPKNLAMAMIVEAGELVEHFQWMSPDESRVPDEALRKRISDELADVLIYLVRIADELDIDLEDSAIRKIGKNNQKYPPSVDSLPFHNTSCQVSRLNKLFRPLIARHEFKLIHLACSV